MEKSGIRVIHGVTLHELHGEDVDLHDSNTKAILKRQQSLNPRRVVLTNRALESGDVVYITLSGSGCCRLGFTNYFDDESSNISDLTGFSLFEDDLFETSKNKQVEINMDGEALEAVYCDRYEVDNATIRRKVIPDQLNHACLFLFCEIVFGNIHILIEAVDGERLLNDKMTGEQIILDNRGFAMLNNTSGSVVIPEIEMKAEQPFLITVKPKQNHSKDCLLVRYGLTNVPLTETTENTLRSYCLVGARVKDEDDVETIDISSWFHIDEIRVKHCSQVFTVCLSKDLGLISNMNRDYDEKNFVVMGPDLQKPMWLVVEVFEADVIIEVPHQQIDETISEGDGLPCSRWVVAIWEEKSITDDALCSFVRLKIDEAPIIARGTRTNTVLMTFKTPRKLEFLKSKLADRSFWELVHLCGVEESSSALVCNLPVIEPLRNIRMFFDNKHKINMTLNISSFEHRNARGEVVLHLGSSPEVISLCKKTPKYNESKLTITPYYKILDDPDVQDEQENGKDIPGYFDERYGDVRKVKYVKDFQNLLVQQELEKVCSEIKWRGKQDQVVRFVFKCECGNPTRCKENWVERSKGAFKGILDSVLVERMIVKETLWEQATGIVESDEVGDEIRVMLQDAESVIDLIGMKEDANLFNIISSIKALKEPPPQEGASLVIKDRDKLDVLVKFHIISDIEDTNHVHIDYHENGKITIHGMRDNILHAKDELLFKASHVQKMTVELPNEKYEKLMNTQMVRDRIESELQKFKIPIQWKVTNQQLTVLLMESDRLEEISECITSVVKSKTLCFKGDVTQHESSVTDRIRQIQDKYNAHAKLTYEIDTTCVSVDVTCIDGVLSNLQEKLHNAIIPFVSKTIKVNLPEYIAKYIYKNLMDELNLNLKRENINPELVQFKNDMFTATGVAKLLEDIQNVIEGLATKVHLEWVPFSVRGIDMYFSGEGENAILHAMRKHCNVQLLTKHEMKDKNVHAVTLLDSCTAIFAIAGSILEPVEPVDILVCPTDSNLRHRGAISCAVAQAGGNKMKKECRKYIEDHGPLEPGQVFMSSAGNLPYQKVFHVLQVPQNSFDDNLEMWIKSTLEQILQTVNSNEAGVLRSIAIPLLGGGTRRILNNLIEIIVKTLEEILGKYRNVREVFLYDKNPSVVREFASQMQAVFGDKCFTLPVENIASNKAKTLKPDIYHALSRSGERTIPLPGGRKFNIRWGELHNQHTDVIVNITTSASSLSGTISEGLYKKANSPSFDLNKEYEMAVQKGGPPADGAVVQTLAGGMSCNVVYHLKIDPKWPDYNGPAMLQSYIQTCLQYAVKTDRSSIAFPTIGTVDCNYLKLDVAQTFVRTIGEFMKKLSSSKLKEISVVIFKTDQESTTQFEETVSKLYSGRPHRLQAVIEETIELNKEGEIMEEKEKEEQNKTHDLQQRQASENGQANKQAMGNMVTPPQPKVPLGTIYAFQISQTVTLWLEVQNIEKIVADVVVCPTPSFPDLFGSIPDALKNGGGYSMQNECRQKYSQGIPKNEIANTGAGTLKFQKVFYIPLQDYKIPSHAKKIKDFVKRCLTQADSLTYTSICFPAIGTGNYLYPDTIVAQAMLGAVEEYFSGQPQHLQKVVIALFPKDTKTIHEFETQAGSKFTPVAVSKGISVPSNQQQPHVVKSGDSLIISIPGTDTSIEISEGQLELSKADVILNTTTSFPNLHGAIPSAICKQGGPLIQTECDQYHHMTNEGDIVVTNAGNLNCKQLFHYVLPNWNPSLGTKIIENCVNKCLDLLHERNYESIAIPAIGTGGYHYDAGMVAEGIYTSVYSYAKLNSNTQCKVKIVLYPQNKDVNKEIEDFFQNLTFTDNNNVTGVPRSKRGHGYHRGTKDRDNMTVAPTKTDFILLKLVSKDTKMIENTKENISKRIRDESVPLSIPFPVHGDEILKDQKNLQILQDLGESYHVDISVDNDKRVIKFCGISPMKDECKEKVRSLLNEMSDKKGNLIVGKTLLKNVEWCYEEDGGNIMVPYPKSTAYNLETELSRGADSVVFKDSDGNKYCVDLRKMEEYRLENKQKKSIIKVHRKDLSTGELAVLPDTWDPMEEGTDVASVPLKHDSPEFKMVASEFKRTLGSYTLQQIHEIRRVQNKHLYQQYMVEKTNIDKKNGRTDNEKSLWHGTSHAKEKAIIENGFSKNYAGNTFGGNVWYGKGVYFALESNYTTDNNYTPPDQNGVKRVFQVKALTGEYTKVDKSYDKKYAPLKTGSDKDRYDSVCDDDADPREFVIFKDTAVYPEYIILFQ